jgi:hypothetical protein
MKIKILNKKSPSGFFTLVISNNLCYLEEDIKINGVIKLITDKLLIIEWIHVSPAVEQEYKYVSEDCIVQNNKKITEDYTYSKYLDTSFNYNLYKLYRTESCEQSIIDKDKKNQLPKDFSTKSYRSLNPDLSNLSDDDLIEHYLNHGIKEKRNYKLSINKHKSHSLRPIFINHEISLTGAPIFLYDFVTYLKNNKIIKNPIMLESYKNNLFDNYNIEKMYHKNNPQKLLKIIQDINPVFIYSNSLNLYYHNIDQFIDYWHKTYFHFHETLSGLDENIISKIKDQKIFVVSDRIKKQFDELGCSCTRVSPPFIPQEKIFHIKNLSLKHRNISNDKVNIGMSGLVSDRKNFHLFYKLAEACPNYNFIWIGGDEDWKISFSKIYGYEPKSLENIKHILHTKNPYHYFADLDYFFLTSKTDPCPIVVLENLLLNNRVITIKDNIFYQHNSSILKENLIEIETSEEDKIIKAFKLLNLNKYLKNNLGEKYITKNFSSPKILSRSNYKDNFLVFNFYAQGNSYIKKHINYFINLINNFNINNKFSYKVFINVNLDNGLKDELSQEKEQFFKQKYQEFFKNIINLEQIQISSNRGWDLNGLLKFINVIYNNNDINENQNVAYLHNKSNVFWREELNKIFYLQDHEIQPYDTVVCDKFFVECLENDLNRNVMKNFHLFKDLSVKKFKFIGGTVFITKLHILKNLYHFNDELISNLTTISTNSDYWISYMTNDEIFDIYYKHYLKDIYNSPIDIESKEIVKKGLAKNYFDLYFNFNKRGIPNFHFEHALERYVGYLISHNKKVKKV